MEKRIKTYKVVAWIVVAILIAVNLFCSVFMVLALSGDESDRLGAAMFGLAFVPSLLCTVFALVFLIKSSKSGIPRTGHIIAYISTSLVALSLSLLELLMLEGPEELYALIILLSFPLEALNLIFSIRGCNAARYLTRQAKAQKMNQQQFIDYQAYPQFQQPNQQYQQYPQFQQPNQK